MDKHFVEHEERFFPTYHTNHAMRLTLLPTPQVFSLKAVAITLNRRLSFRPWQSHLLTFATALRISDLTTTPMLSLACLTYSRRFKPQSLPNNKCTASSKFLHRLELLQRHHRCTSTRYSSTPTKYGVYIPLAKRIVVRICLIRDLRHGTVHHPYLLDRRTEHHRADCYQVEELTNCLFLLVAVGPTSSVLASLFWSE